MSSLRAAVLRNGRVVAADRGKTLPHPPIALAHARTHGMKLEGITGND